MDCTSNCLKCLWKDNCDGIDGCDDFSPVDNSDDIEYYQVILEENRTEYEEIISEFNS